MEELRFRNDILPLKNKLYRLALRITLDSAEAEDIVQETMIKVWNQRDQLDTVLSVEAYCMTICRNMALDRKERKDSQNQELTQEMQENCLLDSSTPHESLVQEERLQIVHQLLNELPLNYREVMQLRDIEGKTYKEIAQILSLTEEQVKVNLFRARQRIREQFKDIENYGL
ncbi:MAG: RNA polymerase sigma factor [Bacteroidaceae bacterium]|nr:RNA polymerase sigma factor [Bacteroidaceae bacterium]